MNTHDIDIELPPLPEPYARKRVWLSSPERAVEKLIDLYTAQQVREQQQAAIEAYQAGRAALKSRDMERIIGAARAALNESFEVNDEHSSIGIPSDRAAYLSLLLDEYDHARRIQGES